MRISLLASLFVLLLNACGDDDKTVIGNTCSESSNCGGDLTCNTAVPGGYCTKACTMTGLTTECPSGSVCDTVEASITCVQICKESSDCRPDLDCNGVSGSNVKACKPVENPVDAGMP